MVARLGAWDVPELYRRTVAAPSRMELSVPPPWGFSSTTVKEQSASASSTTALSSIRGTSMVISDTSLEKYSVPLVWT